MKHEFKPGDPVMVEGKVIGNHNITSDLKKVEIDVLGDDAPHIAWANISKLHPIPTPPRPLRVDELVKGKEYSFNHCGKQQGEFIAIFDGKAVMGVRHPDIPSDFTNRSVLLIDESANIRPVERVVSDDEIKEYVRTLLVGNSLLTFNDVIRTVRHFMKGGSDESK